MTPLYPSPDARQTIDPRVVRQMIATTLAGVLVFLSTAFAGAGTLAPMAETGGSGAGGITIADMLRGDYSPVAAVPEIAVTQLPGADAVAEMIAGDQSPIGYGVV